jgi:hypothetical protein
MIRRLLLVGRWSNERLNHESKTRGQGQEHQRQNADFKKLKKFVTSKIIETKGLRTLSVNRKNPRIKS